MSDPLTAPIYNEVLQLRKRPDGLTPTSLVGRKGTTKATLGMTNYVDWIASGAMPVADTYKDVLILTSPGVLKYLAIECTSTNRTVTLRLMLDGVVVKEKSRAIVNGSAIIDMVGDVTESSTNRVFSFERIPFNTMTVSVKSAIAETDEITIYPIYDLVG